MKKNIIKINLIVLLFLIIMGSKSHAALTSKLTTQKDGKNVVVNTTIANSYVKCKQMINSGESLQGANVKPHLATNKDWGAVSYLSNSIYGTNTAGKNNGVEITINDVKYRSTNGNASGVMNWGSNPYKTLYTQTAGLINNYDPNTSSSATYVSELYANKDTAYVDYINPTIAYQTYGMAIQETSNIFGGIFYANTLNYNCSSLRIGLFAGHFGSRNDNGGSRAGGAQYSDVTFRPVVWN
ncbi:MAG: hypothetical protein IKG14_04750 [Clostridia bacterium]|nr:hypothetical protein [Clostridia bacterium]